MEFNLLTVIEGLSYLVAGAAVLTALFPKAEKAGPILATIRKVLDTLALNIGNARNEGKADSKTGAKSQ